MARPLPACREKRQRQTGAPDYPFLTAEDVLAVIARVRDETGAGNIRLLADFYPLTVNGEDVG